MTSVIRVCIGNFETSFRFKKIDSYEKNLDMVLKYDNL